MVMVMRGKMDMVMDGGCAEEWIFVYCFVLGGKVE